jgi:hypothetical protein
VQALEHHAQPFQRQIDGTGVQLCLVHQPLIESPTQTDS